MQGGSYFVVPTRKGAVPSLTPSQARAVLTEEERIMSISLFDTIDYLDACSKQRVSFAHFSGLGDFQLILTQRTSFLGLHPSAPSTEAGIAGDHERGRSTITLAKWAEIVRTVKPTFAMQLSESIALSEAPSRKRKTAVTRAQQWAAKIHTSEYELKPCKLVPSAIVSEKGQGLLDMVSRNENTLELYEGLHAMSLSAGGQTYMYAYSVPAIVAALANGVSYVESTLPWELAERGIALTFALDTVSPSNNSLGDVEIDLNDDAYTLDIGPICHDCRCYTCQRHNRAYIHHLLTVQEMNSNILLSIHNLFRVAELFRRFRACGDNEDGRNSFLRGILSQY